MNFFIMHLAIAGKNRKSSDLGTRRNEFVLVDTTCDPRISRVSGSTAVKLSDKSRSPGALGLKSDLIRPDPVAGLRSGPVIGPGTIRFRSCLDGPRIQRISNHNKGSRPFGSWAQGIWWTRGDEDLFCHPKMFGHLSKVVDLWNGNPGPDQVGKGEWDIFPFSVSLVCEQHSVKLQSLKLLQTCFTKVLYNVNELSVFPVVNTHSAGTTGGQSTKGSGDRTPSK